MAVALVIKLSGRVFENEELVLKYVEVLKTVKEKICVITGGGDVARRYIQIAKRGGASYTFQDLLGIYSSRLNALLLISLLEDAHPEVPTNLQEVLKACRQSRIVVTGGLQPGQSTATVAALVAEAVKAGVLLNAANIDAVYTDDPRRNPSAKKIGELKYDDLEKILNSSALPGGYELLDLWSLAILKRNCIITYIFDKDRPDYILNILRGGNPGSRVTC